MSWHELQPLLGESNSNFVQNQGIQQFYDVICTSLQATKILPQSNQEKNGNSPLMEVTFFLKVFLSSEPFRLDTLWHFSDSESYPSSSLVKIDIQLIHRETTAKIYLNERKKYVEQFIKIKNKLNQTAILSFKNDEKQFVWKQTIPELVVNENGLKAFLPKIKNKLAETFSDLVKKMHFCTNLSKQQITRLTQLRQTNQKNRMKRPGAYPRCLSLKQKKICTEIMELFKGYPKLENIQLFNVNLRKLNDDRYNMYKEELQKISKIYQNSINKSNICKGIVIEQIFKKMTLNEGQLSKIYQIYCKYKEEVSINRFFEFELPTNISELELKESLAKISKQLPEYEHFFKEKIIHKQATQKGQKSLKNQINFLTWVRNQTNPFIGHYYLEALNIPKGNIQKKKEQMQIHTTIQLKKNQKQRKLYIEYYEKSLIELFNSGQTWAMMNLKSKIEILMGLANLLAFLGENKILHRDLKPGNIMLDANLHPKVIDWGSACNSQKATNKGIGFREQEQLLMTTPKYSQRFSAIQQTESLRNKYTKSQFQKNQFFDVYSFGVILQDFLTVSDLQHFEVSRNWLAEELNYLVSKCKEVNPADRLSPLDIQIYLRQIYTILQNKLS